MNKVSFSLYLWQKLAKWPGGKWLFTFLLGLKAPYFTTIHPSIVSLRPGYCEVHIRKRRAVLNHIGTIHAIAMCNLAELAGGVMTDATIPFTHRWIPKRMTVEYLKKANTHLCAIAQWEPIPVFSVASEVPLTVNITDTSGQLVFRALITMWVSPKKPTLPTNS